MMDFGPATSAFIPQPCGRLLVVYRPALRVR